MSDNRRVTTGKVRLSFPHLLQPRAALEPGGAAKYSVMLLIDKDDKETMKKIRAAEKAAYDLGVAGVFGGKKPAPDRASIIKDADEDGTADDYPERAGCYYMTVSASEAYPPDVVDAQLNEVLSPKQVYSGVYGRVSMQAYPYNTKGNRGVSFGLNNVQVFGIGERLAGGPTAQQEFEPIDVDSDDEFAGLL